MAEEAGNQALMARLYLGYGILRRVGMAYSDDYLSYTTEAARLTHELDDLESQCGVESYLPWAHITNGHFEEARIVVRAISGKLPNNLRFGASVSAIPVRPLIILADSLCLSIIGQLSRAETKYQIARGQMEESGFVDGVVYADFWACQAAVFAGDLAPARQYSQVLFEIAETSQAGGGSRRGGYCCWSRRMLRKEFYFSD